MFSLLSLSLSLSVCVCVCVCVCFSLLLHHPPLTTTATRQRPNPTPAVKAPSAPQDSSKIKTPSQALLAKHARQDTTAPLQVPRRALISVASNPPIARTTSILTLRALTVLTARTAAHVLVTSPNLAFAHYSDGHAVHR
jgi:hypothetical protein